jgi:hypothetical protein
MHKPTSSLSMARDSLGTDPDTRTHAYVSWSSNVSSIPDVRVWHCFIFRFIYFQEPKSSSLGVMGGLRSSTA